MIQLLKPATGHISTTFAAHAARAVVYLFCGIDIGWRTPADWPIVAAARGRVIFAGWSGRDYGYLVVIDHGVGITTWYAHLDGDELAARVGDNVNTGQFIGVMGSSGNAAGRHLHFEVRINGVQIDPEPYLVTTIPAGDDYTEIPNGDEMALTLAPNIVVWPFGWATTYEPDVFASIKRVSDRAALKDWDGDTYVREMWLAYAAQLAVVTRTIAGAVTVTASGSVDQAALTAAVQEAVTASVRGVPGLTVDELSKRLAN